MRALGAEVTRLGDGTWTRRGAPWRSPGGADRLRQRGTGARLLMGAAAGFPIEATFTGDASLRGRPMKRVLDPLRQMGARRGERRRTAAGDDQGGGCTGSAIVNAKASAQVKSAILLAGLRAEGEVEVIEPAPSRDHTEKMLRAFGCDVEVDETPGRRDPARREPRA